MCITSVCHQFQISKCPFKGGICSTGSSAGWDTDSSVGGDVPIAAIDLQVWGGSSSSGVRQLVQPSPGTGGYATDPSAGGLAFMVFAGSPHSACFKLEFNFECMHIIGIIVVAQSELI